MFVALCMLHCVCCIVFVALCLLHYVWRHCVWCIVFVALCLAALCLVHDVFVALSFLHCVCCIVFVTLGLVALVCCIGFGGIGFGCNNLLHCVWRHWVWWH